MKVKRKPRNKMSKKFDVLKPITFEQLGTEEDPCFGKHLDPKTDECSRCGDSELCAIMMQHNNMLKRAKIEAKQGFKDIQEKDLKLADPKKVKLMVKSRVKELAKLNKKGISLDEVVNDIHVTYHLHGYSKKRIAKIINIMVEKSSRLLIEKNKLKYTA